MAIFNSKLLVYQRVNWRHGFGVNENLGSIRWLLNGGVVFFCWIRRFIFLRKEYVYITYRFKGRSKVPHGWKSIDDDLSAVIFLCWLIMSYCRYELKKEPGEWGWSIFCIDDAVQNIYSSTVDTMYIYKYNYIYIYTYAVHILHIFVWYFLAALTVTGHVCWPRGFAPHVAKLWGWWIKWSIDSHILDSG